MADWSIYALLLSQFLMWIVGLTIGRLIYKEYLETLDTEGEATILEGLNEVFKGFSESIAHQIKAEFHGTDTQKLLTQTSVNAIASLMGKEENQTLIAEFMMQSFAAVMEEALPQILQTTTGISPLTEAQVKSMDTKTTNALGALTVNAASEMLPPGVGMILSRLWPEWEEQAQTNPREFMQVLAKAKDWGLLDMFSGLMGNIPGAKGVSPTQSTPISF